MEVRQYSDGMLLHATRHFTAHARHRHQGLERLGLQLANSEIRALFMEMDGNLPRLHGMPASYAQQGWSGLMEVWTSYV